MRFLLQLALLCFLVLTEIACARFHQANLQEGIACFRAKNYRAAFIHLKPEAQRGQPDAQYAVGFMYYYGQGVVEDKRQAWYWIKCAATSGQPEAVEAVKILKNPPRDIITGPWDPLIYNDPV